MIEQINSILVFPSKVQFWLNLDYILMSLHIWPHITNMYADTGELGMPQNLQSINRSEQSINID